MQQPIDLDDAYNNGDHISDSASYPPRWAAAAKAYRADMSARGLARLDVAYGAGERQAYDLFLPETLSPGCVVFVHGGYWRAFDRSSWSHLAEGARAQGWSVALPSYDLCPEVRIPDITQQIASAIRHIAGEVDGPLRLTGHSAGGHLVARMADPDVLDPQVLARIERIVPISPLCDLGPLTLTRMNEVLQIDAGSARSESPRFQAPPACPVTVWVGAQERPVFVDQAQWLAQAWQADLVVEPGKHHFDVIDSLADPKGTLTQAVLQDSAA